MGMTGLLNDGQKKLELAANCHCWSRTDINTKNERDIPVFLSCLSISLSLVTPTGRM